MVKKVVLLVSLLFLIPFSRGYGLDSTPAYSFQIRGAYTDLTALVGDFGFLTGGIKKFDEQYMTTLGLEIAHYIKLNMAGFIEYLFNYDADVGVNTFSQIGMGFKYFPLHLASPVLRTSKFNKITMIPAFNFYVGAEAGLAGLVTNTTSTGTKRSTVRDPFAAGILAGLELPFATFGFHIKTCYRFLYSFSDGDSFAGWSVMMGVQKFI